MFLFKSPGILRKVSLSAVAALVINMPREMWFFWKLWAALPFVVPRNWYWEIKKKLLQQIDMRDRWNGWTKGKSLCKKKKKKYAKWDLQAISGISLYTFGVPKHICSAESVLSDATSSSESFSPTASTPNPFYSWSSKDSGNSWMTFFLS